MSGYVNIVEDVDQEEDEDKSTTERSTNSEESNNQEVEPRNRGQLSRSENVRSDLDIRTSLVEADKTAEIINAYANLMEVSQVKIPEPSPILQPKEANLVQDLGILFNTIPQNVMVVALFCLVVTIAILAFSPGFIYFLLAVASLAAVKIGASNWLANGFTKIQAEVENSKLQVATTVLTSNQQTREMMTREATTLHEKRLKTFENIIATEADVRKFQIKSNETVHTLGFETDLQLKRMTEDGQTQREVLQNETKIKITDLKAEAEKEIQKLRQESEFEKLKSEEKINEMETRTKVTLKTIESQTATTVAEIDRKRLQKEMETNAQTERDRIAADAKKHEITESNKSEQLEKTMAAQKHTAQCEMESKKHAADADVRITEIRERGATDRNKDNNFCAIM